MCLVPDSNGVSLKTLKETKTCEIFGICQYTLNNWLKRDDLSPKKRQNYQQKIDLNKLIKRVKEHPEDRLVDHAKTFGVAINSIWNAFQKLGITKKNSTLQGKGVCTAYSIPKKASKAYKKA